jgi:Rrf2 family nitric oxide-sensitive transcriptional repressor
MLSKTAEYALRVVACLAGDLVQSASADLLCDQTKVPRRYLHKVLQDLVRSELVRSRSGPGGGYVLARVPDAITILDVVNAVAPLERIHHCPLGCRLTRHFARCTKNSTRPTPQRRKRFRV